MDKLKLTVFILLGTMALMMGLVSCSDEEVVNPLEETVKKAMEDARVTYKVAIVLCQENYDTCIINSYN